MSLESPDTNQKKGTNTRLNSSFCLSSTLMERSLKCMNMQMIQLYPHFPAVYQIHLYVQEFVFCLLHYTDKAPNPCCLSKIHDPQLYIRLSVVKHPVGETGGASQRLSHIFFLISK
ncbi:hypothetical protein XENORESO_007480 [Xenotaenia resolanae]|uniref:Uncharacterized protein n=1 Tax=Xenotaenia resolanae TaxID=208358 RepID=A0ABV0VUV0_9TELE